MEPPRGDFVACPRCSQQNHGTAGQCAYCGGPLVQPARVPVGEDAPAAPPRRLTVETITVSQILDAHSGGEKRGSFVSATVRIDPPAPLEELKLLQAEVAMHVYTAVVQDAVSTCSITEEDGKRRLADARENFASLRAALGRKLREGQG